MITFKKASVADVSLIQELAHTIWYSHYPGIITNEQIAYMLTEMYSGIVIEKEIINGYNWTIIFDNEQPIGFIEFHVEKESNSVKLSKLYILVNQHGKGIGQMAIDYVKDFSRMEGVGDLYLTVNKENIKALKAYETAGFKKDKEAIFNIGNGFVMDDYIMKFSF
jgi:diamine N-acetyltransferase